MTEGGGFHIGVLHWKEHDELATCVADTFRELGCRTDKTLQDSRLADEWDAVITCGPFGSLVPLARQLIERSPERRPVFVLWLTEQLANPALPEWLHLPLSQARSKAERLAFRRGPGGQWKLDPRLHWMTTRANRFRYYGDLHWLVGEGVLTVLAVGSRWIAQFLQARGLQAYPNCVGSYHGWGTDLALERDIPVLWLGNVATRRRQAVLERLRTELRSRGTDILMVDGVEHPYVMGHDRTCLLNRTKIVLNILRTKWDNHSLRYFLSAPNRALVVTEPTYPHIPFEPGRHCVEAPVEKLADTICYYLEHENERRDLAEEAHKLATTELDMRRSVARILEWVRGCVLDSKR